MRRFIIFFIILSHIFLFSQLLFSQSNIPIDSSKLALNKASNKDKISILYTLIQYEINNNLTTAQEYATKLNNLSESMPAYTKT